MGDNQPELQTFADKINSTTENTNNQTEQVDNKTEIEESTSMKEDPKREDISTSQTIMQNDINNDNKNEDSVHELNQIPQLSAIPVIDADKAEMKKIVIECKEEISNKPQLNNSNDNQSNIKTIIDETKLKEDDVIDNKTEQVKEKEIIKLEQSIIEEKEEYEPKENKVKTKDKIELFKPKITSKKINSPKQKTTRNNKSEIYQNHNLLAMNSLPSSPKASRPKKGILSSKAKEQAEKHKQLNSTTIQIEDRPEMSSSTKNAKQELFNSTYQRFQEKMKQKGDKIENLRKKIEEKERNGVTGIPKINKSKLSSNESDFLSRQKEYEQKIKEKKDKLATEAQLKIDKELNIVSKQSKINKEEVNDRLLHFKEWEEKKKQKIDQMKMAIEKKAIAEINNGKLHKGAKCNIDDSCKRLYQDDVKKRQENKQILQTMFKPTFKPTINSGKKKVQKDKEVNSDKTKYKGLDKGSEKKPDIKTTNEKEKEEINNDKLTIQINESVNLIEEDSKILPTDFLTERNTDAFREKLFRNRPKFIMKQSPINQTTKITDSFCLDTE